jgi:hypothetical protein
MFFLNSHSFAGRMRVVPLTMCVTHTTPSWSVEKHHVVEKENCALEIDMVGLKMMICSEMVWPSWWGVAGAEACRDAVSESNAIFEVGARGSLIITGTDLESVLWSRFVVGARLDILVLLCL